MIPTLLRLGDLKLLELVIDRLERGAELTLLRTLLRLLMLGDRWIVREDGALAAGCLLRVLALDLELLLRLVCAMTGSAKKIKAETSSTRAVLTPCWYFDVNMICLLSSLLAIISKSAILLPFRGTNSRSSNENSHLKHQTKKRQLLDRPFSQAIRSRTLTPARKDRRQFNRIPHPKHEKTPIFTPYPTEKVRIACTLQYTPARGPTRPNRQNPAIFSDLGGNLPFMMPICPATVLQSVKFLFFCVFFDKADVIT